MTTPLDLLYHKIGLKLKKLEDQKRFNFLKTLECDYCSTDFSILDPFNLQHHPFVKKEQIRWIEKMGVGSYNSRFQADHIALQNGLSQRLTPQGFFTPCSLEELSHEVRSFLNEKEGDSLVQTFEKDPLGLLLLGFEQHLKAPLIQTSCAPFA
ncbi:MAG: hypothetical protein ACOYL1_06610, partial [Chlamydiia bacterium]